MDAYGAAVKCFAAWSVPNTLISMLDSEDRAILDFEQGWWLEAGPKDQAIELGLGLSAALYYDHLLGLIGDPRAMAYDPLTVRRVLSLIEPTGEGEVAI